jgi:hypothetical protein
MMILLKGRAVKRIGSYIELDDSALCYWKDEDGLWWLYLPNCGAGVLKNHKVKEHEDGTITVQPSIKMIGHLQGTQTEIHGYLERGLWRDV